MKSVRRLRILLAPVSVKVKQRIFSGPTSVCLRILAVRIDNSCVLPVPGPAMTRSGPSM